jgi:hypothetical protein
MRSTVGPRPSRHRVPCWREYRQRESGLDEWSRKETAAEDLARLHSTGGPELTEAVAQWLAIRAGRGGQLRLSHYYLAGGSVISFR